MANQCYNSYRHSMENPSKTHHHKRVSFQFPHGVGELTHLHPPFSVPWSFWTCFPEPCATAQCLHLKRCNNLTPESYIPEHILGHLQLMYMGYSSLFSFDYHSKDIGPLKISQCLNK